MAARWLWIVVVLLFAQFTPNLMAQPAATQPKPAPAPAKVDRSKEIVTEIVTPTTEEPQDIPRSRMKATASTTRHGWTDPIHAIDGALDRGWTSELGAIKTKGPQWLQLELDQTYLINGLRWFLSPQMGRVRYISYMGRIERYEIAVSLDGKNFTNVASGQWDKEDFSEKRVQFPQVQARFVRLIALSGETASATEVVLESPQPPVPAGIVVPQAADAAARRQAFAQRNSPERLKVLADRLARQARRDNPALAEFFRLHEQGDSVAAVSQFNRAVVERLKKFAPMLLEKGEELPPPAVGVPTEMMRNIISGEPLRSKFDVGQPGSIAWDSEILRAEKLAAGQRAIDTSMFGPLLNAYAKTGDDRYLQKWSEYFDDIMLNEGGYRLMTSFNMADRDAHGTGRVRDLLTHLLRVELAQPGTFDKLSKTTLPLVLLEMFPDHMALGAAYYHANAQNWTPHQAVTVFRMGAVLDRLIVQDVGLMERAWRLLDTYESRSNFPDGAEVEQAMWYNWGYAHASLEFLNSIQEIEKIEPGLVPITPMRRAELEEAMLRRLRFTVRMFTPKVQWPLFLRGDDRAEYGIYSLHRTKKLEPGDDRGMRLENYADRVVDDPVMAPVLATIGPEKKPGAQPNFTSNYFPWGGYRIIRESWNPKAQYGVMFASPSPGKYWARGGAENLSLGLSAFGVDLLIDDAKGHYSGFPSPLMVNGKSQDYRLGYPNWGHKQLLINAWDKPDTSRWLSSDAIEFMEGEYRGVYGDFTSSKPEDIAADVAKAIHGVTHGRQVVYLRSEGLWIVTDRLRSEQPRRYTWRWMLPCKLMPSKTDFAFTPTEIVVNDAEKSIVTNKANGTNLTMRTFSPAAMKFKRSERTKDKPWNNICEINPQVENQRNFVAVTAILPRPSAEEDFRSITAVGSKEAEGFIATLPSGANVTYQAARETAAVKLSAYDIQSVAEVLVTTTRDGTTTGLVLGCASMSVQGNAVKLAHADFAFTSDGKKLTSVTPIFRPIERVTIEPGCNVFTEREQVRISCPTPGVEIRYTLDGGDPSLASPLYREPISVTATTTVKARAFRPGVKLAADDLDFTRSSPVSTGVFEKRTLIEPAKTGELQPGLHAAFFDGEWKKMLVTTAGMTPAAQGTVANLFDLSLRNNTGPFTIVYQGYLNVPTDGVYTFHAPPEMMDNKIDNGYELVLEVAGQTWQPTTRRHALGTWSVALKKGVHSFGLKYLDYRGNRVELDIWGDNQVRTVAIDYTRKGPAPRNFPGLLADYVWGGGVPELLVSGPGLERQPIPTSWLCVGR